jgi:hypothetical protein
MPLAAEKPISHRQKIETKKKAKLVCRYVDG